nr:hypothetical protein CPGR_02277 [Mycolicibacterium fortuitum subsp. fortuitum DSM 46621 = ATCC 6841 = JCM 6387]
MNSPIAEDESIGSVNERSAIPRAFNPSRMASRSLRLRAMRSSFHTTSV